MTSELEKMLQELIREAERWRVLIAALPDRETRTSESKRQPEDKEPPE